MITPAVIPPSSEQVLDLVRVRTLAKSGHGRDIRLAAGLSLADIADAIGVSSATVHRWERGVRKPYGLAAHRYGALMDSLERMVKKPDG
jgi:DNA-binding transcriptional regulator YiaG